MGTIFWVGGAARAVPQISQFTITAYSAATTYNVTIGNFTVSQVGTGGTVATTAAAFVNTLNAAPHQYFGCIYWVDLGAGVVQGTAAGASDPQTYQPFVFTTSVTGGTGTIGGMVTGQSHQSKDCWYTPANWSTGVIPVNGDDVVFKDNSNDMRWGIINSSALTYASLRIYKSYTGKIGPDPIFDYVPRTSSVITDTVDKPEYRDFYFKTGATVVKIGEHYDAGSPAGSSRLRLDLTTVATTVDVIDTASTSADAGQPAVRLLCVNTANAIRVRYAPGGVGIASEVPGAVSTIGTFACTDTSSTSRCHLGAGTTINTSYTQTGGVNVLESAATVPLIRVEGGTLQTEGSYATTTADVYGGTVAHNSSGTTTTLNMYGGTVDTTGSRAARTITTLAYQTGGEFISHGGVVTVTNITKPSIGYRLAMSTI